MNETTPHEDPKSVEEVVDEIATLLLSDSDGMVIGSVYTEAVFLEHIRTILTAERQRGEAAVRKVIERMSGHSCSAQLGKCQWCERIDREIQRVNLTDNQP